MISALRTCPKCGWGIPADAPEGGCPGCLLESGLSLLAHEEQDSSARSDARFGIYEIERHPDGSLYELGRGGMGVTYRAVDTSLQRKVALKIIKVGIGRRSAAARERFMREARMAAALRHENIATIYQFGIREDTGQYFYAMELIEGETLEERVRLAGPLSVRTTIDIAQQVTAALAVAEKHGLVHRDLKPANLMLVSADDEEPGSAQRDIPTVKVIDFGLAKVLNVPVDAMDITHDGFVGTPAFASPEQFEKSTLDVRSDIYSLGATLWFALTGSTPFASHKVEEIHHAQQSDALRIEQLKAAQVPSRLRLLLESMLAFEPAARPGTHQLTAELRRCTAEARGERRAGIGLAAAAVLVLGAAAFSILWPLSRGHRPAAVTEKKPLNLAVPAKSLAVLPFENLSGDRDNAYFADGVQGEILTDLAKVADLKVISRTSVMQYQSGTERNVRQIGQELGVAHVVEGSVQRAGGRVRVNAQLIDARTDRHLWAKTYDREVADVFAIESEVAQLIANELEVKLSASEKASIEEIPTPDLTAYDFYVRATPLVEGVGDSPTQEKDLSVAVDLLNQAVARDPSFVLAWCELAHAHDQAYFQGIDRTPARLALAKSAIDSAFRLKPDSGEAHLALASYLYYGYFDFDRARAELAIAQRTLPNNAEVFELAGLIDRRQSRWSDAVRNFERASELDPRNLWKLENLAVTYFMLRDYGRDQNTLNRMLGLGPNNVFVRTTRASRETRRRGDTRPLHEEIEKVLTEDPAQAESDHIKRARFVLAMFERDFAAADRAVAMLPQQDSLWDDYSRDFWVGVVARMKGDATAARAAFTSARADQEKRVRAQPGNGPLVSGLGVIDAGLDRKEDALREGRRAIEITPIAKDSINGAPVLANFAIICAWSGERDLAIEQLEALTKIPGGPHYGDLRLHPFWDPLRGDPRFEKIVTSLAPKGASP